MTDPKVVELFKENSIIIIPNFLYFCYACSVNCQNEKGGISHCNTPEHAERLSRFNKIYKIIPRPDRYESTVSLACNFCDLKVSWSQAKSHVKEHDCLPWFKPDDLYETYFKNYITLNNKTHLCNLCLNTYATWIHVIEHIKNSTHQEAWSKSGASKTNIESLGISPKLYERLTSHRIFIGDYDPFFCYGCKVLCSDLNNAVYHMQSRNHRERRKVFTNMIKDCTLNIPNLKWIKKISTMVVMRDKIYCKHCDLYLTEREELDHHMKKHDTQLPKTAYQESALIARKKRNEAIAFREKRISPNVTGKDVPCLLSIPEQYLWMISDHGVQVYHEYLHCIKCNVKMGSDRTVDDHMKTHLIPEWREKHFGIREAGNNPSTSNGAEDSCPREDQPKRNTESSNEFESSTKMQKVEMPPLH